MTTTTYYMSGEYLKQGVLPWALDLTGMASGLILTINQENG